MHLEFTYTASDFEEMRRFALGSNAAELVRASMRKSIGYFVFIALMVVIYVVFLRPSDLANGQPVSSTNGDSPPFAITVVIVIGVIGIFAFSKYRHHRFVQKKLVPEPGVLGMKWLDITPDSIWLTDPFSRTQWRRESFASWNESANLILLNMQNRATVMVPKRAMTEDQQNELRNLLGNYAMISPMTV